MPGDREDDDDDDAEEVDVVVVVVVVTTAVVGGLMVHISLQLKRAIRKWAPCVLVAFHLSLKHNRFVSHLQ
jgi:hypothetical protein